METRVNTTSAESEAQDQAGRQHALLSPSSAHRWLMCTPSAMHESRMPDESSVFAREGSLAHAICARTILRRLGRDTEEADSEILGLHEEFEEGIEEMQEHADTYADVVLRTFGEELDADKGAEIHIETPLDLDEWAPGSFGTSDAVVVGRDTLHVFDFKYGRGVQVDAEGNAQMRLYALGALDEFCVGRDIRTVRMTIVQPRVGGLSAATMSRDALLHWGTETLRPLAEVAARGLGARRAGRWCKFCRAVTECEALDHVASSAMIIDINRQDARSLGETCLPMCGPLEQWVEDVRSRALTMLIRGEDVPGYKAVRKRGRRVITDPDALGAKLESVGVEPERIYRPRELKTLGDLEKTVGKKAFATLAGELVSKKEGELTIAEATDRREADTGAGAFDGIEIND